MLTLARLTVAAAGRYHFEVMDPLFLLTSSLLLLVCAVIPAITLREGKGRSIDTEPVDDSELLSGFQSDGHPSEDAITLTVNDDSSVTWVELGHGVEINQCALSEVATTLFEPEVCAIIARLHRELQPFRSRLLEARVLRQKTYDRGLLPDFLDVDEHPDSHGEWKVAELPDDLLDRRVEITGPASDAKMVINMLSRGKDGQRADAAMLDLEDSMKPSWSNVASAIANVRDAARGTLTYTKPATGKTAEKIYSLDPDDMPLLMVRMRGLHLEEVNIRVDGENVSAGLLDFALCAYHSAHTLMEQGRTPKYYVPKVEHYLEARWWNILFSLTENEIGLSEGSIRMTLLIETLPAAFQMEEILFETRKHAAGLNGGRWDKIFSDIKVLKEHPDRIMADRGSIGMDRPWMKKYALQLIRVCHRHGAFAMGGMAAFTPGSTAKLRKEQKARVVADKKFESSIGHDGCWVSHPFFIGPARKPFSKMNQLGVSPDLEDNPDLLPDATGPVTMEGLRKNVRVGIAYLHAWNHDIGCVAWDNLMEDLATLEISRAQTWQWLRHTVTLESGEYVTQELVEIIFAEELARIESELLNGRSKMSEEEIFALIDPFRDASSDACALYTDPDFRPFLTLRSDGAHLNATARRLSLTARPEHVRRGPKTRFTVQNHSAANRI